MRKRITKKDVEEFNAELQKQFNIFGVVKADTFDFIGYDYKLETEYGTLYILPRNEVGPANYGWSIMMRFDVDSWNKEKATQLIGNDQTLNKFSGKWNIHCSEAVDAITLFSSKMRVLNVTS